MPRRHRHRAQPRGKASTNILERAPISQHKRPESKALAARNRSLEANVARAVVMQEGF